jgi:flagellin
MISIQTNVNSMNAQENLRTTTDFQARTISRLTSGYRINQSGDDAAGLSVANKFRSDVAELTQGVRNANDGLSTLQVIDGGLSNISKMLDRLKTLATQSASSTFEGNRALLNTEYQDLATEITRQAGAIGLGAGATGGRYNRSLEVYVGGAQQGTPKVSIDLAGSGSKVDAGGLGLSGTSINGGAVSSLTGNGKDISASTNLLVNAGVAQSQVFTFNITKPGSASFQTTVQVDGTTTGIDANEVLSQLNASLNQHGISANLDSNGELAFSGDVAFTATTTGLAAGNGSLVDDGATVTVENASKYRKAGIGAWADTTSVETVKITVGGSSVSAAIASGSDQAATLTKLNDTFNALGVYAVAQADGGGIEFQSSADFDIESSGGVAAKGVFAAGLVKVSADDPSTTASATSAAEAAITAISAAVGALGVVQGKIGTGQNKLQYAISLAQSQITNFSAAESRIRDADVAQEAANLTKAQVLSQASMAALAQANSAPQSVLSLLRG